VLLGNSPASEFYRSTNSDARETNSDARDLPRRKHATLYLSTKLPSVTYWLVTTVICAYLYNRIGVSHLFRFMSIFISACKCEDTGSIGVSCDGEGRCQCKDNFDGNRCEKCKEGFYNYPICEGSIVFDSIVVEAS